MPKTARLKIPVALENSRDWYQSYKTGLNMIDTSLYATREDRNYFLLGGGTFTFTIDGEVGTLSWTEDIILKSSITGYEWVVEATSIDLTDGQVFYVSLVRSPTANVVLTITVADKINSNDDDLVIGLFKNGFIYFRNSKTIQGGDSLVVFDDSSVPSPLIVQEDAANVGTRPLLNFSGDTADVTDNPGNNSVDVVNKTPVQVNSIAIGARKSLNFSPDNFEAVENVVNNSIDIAGIVPVLVDNVDTASQSQLNLTGENFTVADNPGNNTADISFKLPILLDAVSTSSRQKLNFSSDSFAVTDNGGAGRTDITGKVGVLVDATPISAQPKLNFASTNFNITDNGGSSRADILFELPVLVDGVEVAARPKLNFSSNTYVVTDNGMADRADITSVFTMSVFIPDSPDVADTVMYFPVAQSIALPINLTGSRAIAKTASTGTATFDIKKNGASIGSIVFTASATGTFTFASAQTFTNTDSFEITAPSPQDATLANIAFTFIGTK